MYSVVMVILQDCGVFEYSACSLLTMVIEEWGEKECEIEEREEK